MAAVCPAPEQRLAWQRFAPHQAQARGAAEQLMPKRGRRNLKKIEEREDNGVQKKKDAVALRAKARSKAASRPKLYSPPKRKRKEERSPSLVPTEVYVSDTESVLEDGGNVQSHDGDAAAAEPAASGADESDAGHAATEFVGPATNVSIGGASSSGCTSKRSIGTDTDSLFQ